MLKAFVPTGNQCNWPGCCNEAVETTLPVVSKSKHCIKHHLRKHSGRVGPNWKRDHYREHLKPICEMSEITWGQTYKSVVKAMKKLKPDAERYEVIRRTCQQFDVDHIDGNHYNNSVNNLQTLLKTMHKLKTDVMGDANPMRYKNEKNV